MNILSLAFFCFQDDLVSSCDRHIALLNHVSDSSEEYKMSIGDKAVTTGRNWFPILLSCTWTSLLSFLLKKAIGIIVYFLNKMKRFRKLKVN